MRTLRPAGTVDCSIVLEFQPMTFTSRKDIEQSKRHGHAVLPYESVVADIEAADHEYKVMEIVNQCHEIAEQHGEIRVKYAWHAGKGLEQARKLHGKHGGWEDYRDSIFTGEPRTARAYQRLFKKLTFEELDGIESIGAANRYIHERDGGKDDGGEKAPPLELTEQQQELLKEFTKPQLVVQLDNLRELCDANALTVTDFDVTEEPDTTMANGAKAKTAYLELVTAVDNVIAAGQDFVALGDDSIDGATAKLVYGYADGFIDFGTNMRNSMLALLKQHHTHQELVDFTGYSEGTVKRYIKAAQDKR